MEELRARRGVRGSHRDACRLVRIAEHLRRRFDREAQELAKRNSLGRCIEYILELTRRTAPTGVGIWKRDAQMTDAQCNLDYFMDDVVIAGDPESVTAQLLALRERIGPFGTLVLVAHDWDDRSSWLRSLELFAREVVPAFNRAIAHG